MSKFHINKHGVPAPCRAVKGNCPLGGNSGEEGHFDSKEEAQVHADNINKKEYGVTPEMAKPNIEVDQKDFDKTFPESYNNGFSRVTGPTLAEMRTMPTIAQMNGEVPYNPVPSSEETQRIYENIPYDIKSSVDEDRSVVIPEKNIRDEMDSNMVSTVQSRRETYNQMVDTVSRNSPESIDRRGNIADGPLRDEIVDFATEKAKEDSSFSMNGQKIYVQTKDDRSRNYAQEYFDSGRYNDFINKAE